jgi:hypothetical protein
VNFEAYLISKKIDSEAFRRSETSTWESWNSEFEQMHPNSFTAQKLYLINPVRRKYPYKAELVNPAAAEISVTPVSTQPKVAKPVMRPKPKIG